MKLKSLVVICSRLLCPIATQVPTPAQQPNTASAPTESEKLNRLLENAFAEYLKSHPV